MNKGSREDSGLYASDREAFSTALRRMCCKHKSLPSSYAITNELERIEEFPYRRGGSADVFCGWYRGSKVAIKRIRRGSNHANVERACLSVHLRFEMALTRVRQRFCHEVVLWKQFRHPNLLPLLGATKYSDTLTMVSEWMENGTIMDFIVAHPGTNRLKLASVPENLK